MNRSTVYIIGAGAIGKSLAVFLKHHGRNVMLIRGSVDNMPPETEKIQIELNDKTTLEASIETSTLSHFPRLDGIIVLTNKSFGNKDLSQALHGKTGNSPLIILQNGLGIEQPFIDAGFPEIFRCVLFATSQVVSGTTVRFKPVSVSAIGVIRSAKDDLNEIVVILDTANFRFRPEINIQPLIWKKAIANSVFNSVCPLLDIDNGIFHRNETALIIAKRVICECVAIANKKGIPLTGQEVLESVLVISKASDGQLISTLQDIRNKRKTEIETLNFAIVDIASELNRESLVKETRLLGELTKLKSELALEHN